MLFSSFRLLSSVVKFLQIANINEQKSDTYTIIHTQIHTQSYIHNQIQTQSDTYTIIYKLPTIYIFIDHL